MKDITKEIKIFLWQGGKTSNKNVHLLKWETMIYPYNHDGLEIKSPTTTNKALGAKILWHLISRELVWWKYMIVRKYLHLPRQQYLNLCLREGPCTPIWKECNDLDCIKNEMKHKHKYNRECNKTMKTQFLFMNKIMEYYRT